MRLRLVDADLRCLIAENPGPLTLDGTRSWILGRTRRVVVDPGPDAPGQVDALVRATTEPSEPPTSGRATRGRSTESGADAAEEAVSVEAVCLTHSHADHAGCAREVAEHLRVPLRGSTDTLRRLGVAGRPLADGEEVPVDGGESVLVALETPGHSRDHLAYLWRPSSKLLTGDLVLGEGSSLVVHPDGEVGAYLSSLARLLALRPRALLPGHGPPVEEAVPRLEQYRAHRLERDRQVRRAVEGGARSVAAVREAVYGELPRGLRRPAELSVLAHLAHLRQLGDDLPSDLEAELEAVARAGGGTELVDVPRRGTERGPGP